MRVRKQIVRWILTNKLPFIVICIAFATNLSLTVFNGMKVCKEGVCGIYFGSLHYHDFLWHFALTVNSFKTIPFPLPIYAGSHLEGYNFLIDAVLYVFFKIGIPVASSYFILLPLVYLISMSVLGFIYLKRKNKDPLYIASGLFFLFFGSSFSYILSLYHTGTWQSFMRSQAMQSGRALLNMQYALTLPLILLSLIILEREKLGRGRILLLSFLLFLVFGLKFYGGVVFLAILLTSRAMVWTKTRKIGHLAELGMYGLFCLFAYLLFYRTTQSDGSFPLSFAPFSIAHPMIEERDMFYVPSLVLARYTLASANIFSPRLLAIELMSAAIFLLYNMGTRLVGLAVLTTKLVQKKISRLEGSMIFAILLSGILTLLFVQKREWWNIIQFLGYTLFFLNFFAGEMLYVLLKSGNKLLLVLAMVSIVLTLPTNIEQIGYAMERHVSISDGEIEALAELKKQRGAVVLVLPLQDTSYVAALAEKQLYIADENPLNLIGVDYRKRLEGIKNLDKLEFDKDSVTHMYVKKTDPDYKPIIIPSRFRRIFDNRDAAIYAKQ